MDKDQHNTVIFNASKRELFTTNSGYKSLQKKLRAQWKIQSMKEELTEERMKGVRLWITAGPREKFTASEMEVLKQFLEKGGNVFVMLGEGGESKFDTNINFLLEDLGIMVNSDSVVRNVYYKYFHPKEALVSNGVLNREISRAAGKVVTGIIEDENVGNNAQALTFVYPYGATLSVMKPAVAVLSTGSVCFPLNRPVLAFYQGKDGGKFAVLGSCHMFSDQYIDKEENSKILDVLLHWFMTDTIQLNQIDAEDPEVFPPTISDLPPPMLELFDLDESFSSEKVRLAQLTNKCTEDDLEFYVRKCGEILGVTAKLDKEKRDAKHILEHVFFKVVEFKKLNQEQDIDTEVPFNPL
ncbi:hypothetical protein WMY93_019825 [Mugilogobius chulae]|uniref:ABC-type uncharacterized transport system domain-containing protein n=1 Tax=Mugilogobius chulae TaxID=88201 RepID=A0AAW0NK38_9GOBI